MAIMSYCNRTVLQLSHSLVTIMVNVEERFVCVLNAKQSMYLFVVITSILYNPDLQVCVVEMADADWNMLPRQAQSISSDQVQMQQQ